MKKKQPFAYGKDPNPTNWHEAAAALKSHSKTKKRTPVLDRLDKLETQLKAKK